MGESKGNLAYDLDVGQYERIRTISTDSPMLLLVLHLPPGPADWLKCSPQTLTLRKCATGSASTARAYDQQGDPAGVPAQEESAHDGGPEEAGVGLREG